MNVDIRSGSIAAMYSWLKESRDSGKRDEEALRQILSLPDYAIEFQRYGDPRLPICGISFEEAVDFFLHYDEKEFQNPRLASKQPTFLAFVQNLDHALEQLELLSSLGPDDLLQVEQILAGSLPDWLLQEQLHFTLLLTISIGNSMGWPYGHYIHFDVANLGQLGDRESLLHVLAHEIHHILFPRLLPQSCSARQAFFVRFAAEGLAMHFCNNAATLGKPSKYPGKAFCISESDWAFYEEQHQELIQRVLSQGERAQNMSLAEVQEMTKDYFQAQFRSLKTGQQKKLSQYPAYYIGCYLWGTIDLQLGKERLFQVLNSYDGFWEAWSLCS